MLKPKSYPILLQAVEEGVLLGLNRCAKRYDVNTFEDVVAGCITDSVMECILDLFDIDDKMAH